MGARHTTRGRRRGAHTTLTAREKSKPCEKIETSGTAAFSSSRSIDFCNKKILSTGDPSDPDAAHCKHTGGHTCTRLLHEPQQAQPGTVGAPQARKILGAPQARENFEELDRLDAASAVAAASAAAAAPTQPQNCEREWESSTHGQVSGSRPSGEAWRPKEGGWRGARAHLAAQEDGQADLRLVARPAPPRPKIDRRGRRGRTDAAKAPAADHHEFQNR